MENKSEDIINNLIILQSYSDKYDNDFLSWTLR